MPGSSNTLKLTLPIYPEGKSAKGQAQRAIAGKEALAVKDDESSQLILARRTTAVICRHVLGHPARRRMDECDWLYERNLQRS